MTVGAGPFVAAMREKWASARDDERTYLFYAEWDELLAIGAVHGVPKVMSESLRRLIPAMRDARANGIGEYVFFDRYDRDCADRSHQHGGVATNAVPRNPAQPSGGLSARRTRKGDPELSLTNT